MAVNRNERIPNPTSVNVSPAAGEFLFFRLQAGGPVPKFRVRTDFKGMILNQGRFSKDPATRYEWAYLKDPADIQQLEILSVNLVFATNAQYRYQVSVNGPNGKLRDVLDIDYTGTANDFEVEEFNIVIR